MGQCDAAQQDGKKGMTANSLWEEEQTEILLRIANLNNFNPVHVLKPIYFTKSYGPMEM